MITVDYKRKIQAEMKALCHEAVELIHELLEHAKETETIVFYQKIEGDYYRYLCEFAKGEE